MEPGSPVSSRRSSEASVVEAFLASEAADDGTREAVREELTAAALAPEERAEQLDAFYTTTVGSVFVWTLENVVAGLLHLAVYVIAEAVLGGPLRLVQWCSCSTALSAAAMAGLNAAYAFSAREPGVSSRAFMMVTQAYCGTVSYVGLVFSAVAWEAAGSARWRALFIADGGALAAPALVAVAVANNGVWLLSLVLTYCCTPFGQSNAAFAHIPVGAALLLFLVLANEAGTGSLGVCGGVDAAVFALANGAICASAALDSLSALEADPAHVFPEFMHSTARQRARVDPWALLHGSALLFLALAYGAVGRFSSTAFFGVAFVLVFLLGVTALQGLDLRYVLERLLRVDDADERRARALEQATAVAVLAAAQAKQPAEAPAPPRLHKRRRAGAAREPAVDLAQLREGRERFRDALRLPSAVAMFPHIPVSLRRTAR